MATTGALNSTQQAILDNYIKANQPQKTVEIQPSEENQSALSKMTSTFDTFLKMLTTQLQYQDPLQPQDSTEFTNQLVSFTNVEQNIATNKKLDQLISLNASGGATSMLGYIGKYVEISGDKVALQNGQAQIAYTLAGPAKSVEITFYDAKGAQVGAVAGKISTGPHVMSWDGMKDGQQLPDGAYSYKIKAVGNDDQPVKLSDSSVIVRVTGVESGANGATLSMGRDIDMPDTSVLAIYESRLADS